MKLIEKIQIFLTWKTVCQLIRLNNMKLIQNFIAGTSSKEKL